MSDNNTDAEKAEALLNQSGGQRRHQTEPSTASDDASSVSLQAAIEQMYAEIDAGEKPENVTIRDKNLVALLDGLDEAGMLADVVARARSDLGRDGEEVSRSEAARLLIRVGLMHVDRDVIETAVDARKAHESSDIQF